MSLASLSAPRAFCTSPPASLTALLLRWARSTAEASETCAERYVDADTSAVPSRIGTHTPHSFFAGFTCTLPINARPSGAWLFGASRPKLACIHGPVLAHRIALALRLERIRVAAAYPSGTKESVPVNTNLYTWFTEFDLISTGPVQRNSKRQQECSPIPRIQRWHSGSSRYTGTFPVRSIYPRVELDHVCGLELRVRLPSLRCISDLSFLCNYIRYI